jgi:hypothetical protein
VQFIPTHKPFSAQIEVNNHKFHDSPTNRETTELALGLTPTAWDGLAIVTFSSLDGIKAIFSDPEFVEWVVADEPKFCKTPSVTQRFVILGDSEVLYERNAPNTNS